MKQKTHVTKAEGSKIIDDYFASIEKGIEALLREAFPPQALMLKTADDQNLVFPEEIQEASQITVGTGPVRLEDGRIAVGDFTMPDGRILTIDSQGIITKIKDPTPEEIADSIRQTMQDLRAQVKALRATQGRAPFRLK